MPASRFPGVPHGAAQVTAFTDATGAGRPTAAAVLAGYRDRAPAGTGTVA
ncbi:hypothetical protein ACODT3_34560 [Streptomyces sp. 4.24]